MTQQSLLVDARDFDPFQPVFDPRRAQKPALIKGKNFLYDVDGPRSAFDTEFFDWFKYGADTRRNWQEFLVEDEFFYGTPTGLWRIDAISKEPILLLPMVVQPQFRYWPWTFAKVGASYFFAQHDRGLWKYAPDEGSFRQIATPYGDKVRGVCESYGRLVVLGENVYFWSELEDGTALTASTTTGAGAQSLSILSNTAYRVDAVADGFIVTTNKGYIKAEFVAAAYVFRHYVLSRSMKPFSPNASVVLPDIGLLTLDTRGFYVSAGKVPEPWEPAMGEYFSKNIVARLDRRRLGCLALHFSYAEKALIVSYTPNEREGTYLRALVYLIPSGKWGMFNRPHLGFFEVLQTPENIVHGAYMDVNGYIQRFTLNRDCEIAPAAPLALLDFVVRKPDEPPIRIEQGRSDLQPTFVGVTDVHLTDFAPAVLSSSVERTGLYELQETNYDAGRIGISYAHSGGPDPDWY